MPYLIQSLIIASIYLLCGTTSSAELDLNEKEKVWLNSHSEIRLGAITGWPPYNFYDSNGTFTGISAEIIKRIELNTGLKFKYIKGDWDDLRLQIKEHKVDILSAVYFTPERAGYMLFTRPYSELRDYIFTRKDRNDIKDVKSIRHIAIVKGFSQGEIIKERYPNIKITWYDSMLLALEGVIAGHVDAYIGSISSVSYLISSKQLIELKVAASTGWNPVDVSMAVDTDQPELLGILNKAINTIEEQEVNKINRQWFALEHDDFINYKQLGISLAVGLVLFAITSIWLFLLLREVKARKKAEGLSRQREQNLSITLNSIGDAVIATDEKGNVTNMNPIAESLTGWSFQEVHGQAFRTIFSTFNTSTGKPIENPIDKVIATSENIHVTHHTMLISNDGTEYQIAGSASPILDNGNILGVVMVFNDVTERYLKDEQLRRSQKMDALGKLTGGIAHDYNNMLGIIIGYSDVIEKMAHDQPELIGYINEIRHAGERGAKLTKKLLTFSRYESSENRIVNLNALLEGSQHMLEKTLTVRINLVYELEKNLWSINLDEGDLEDAILNMSINAMHAIKGNGQITFETCNETIKKIDAQHLQIPTGDYVLLSITDTGCGMDNQTKENIFDPFFSTKGEFGTGLGLSQVYGFAHRSKGNIKIYSELGKGSRFTLYFPRYYEKDIEEKQFIEEVKTNLSGKHTILVVDDEPALVELSSHILTEHGYQVFIANSGKEALLILEKESVDVLFSDVIMSEMDGYELASIVQDKYPNIKIQLASGFSTGENITRENNVLSQNLLQKPYGSQKLLEKIRALLTS